MTKAPDRNNQTTRKRVMWIILATLILTGLVAARLAMIDRVRALGFNTRLESPGLIRTEANGRVIDAITRGRNSSGGPFYRSRFSDRMDFYILWYDFAENRAWEMDIAIRSRDLSAFDPKRRHAIMTITVGPGADVTVHTGEPLAMRLIHENRMEDIPPDTPLRVILQELCGRPVPLSDPRVARMIQIANNPEDTMYHNIRRRMDEDKTYFAEHGKPVSRCENQGEG